VGKKEQKITIAGDADFLSNIRVGSQILGANYMSWLTDEAFPVHIFSIPPTDTLLKVSLKSAETQKIILVWILPAAVLILGAVILLRRKRQ
jgi:ABC-2 type transport system permease protein